MSDENKKALAEDGYLYFGEFPSRIKPEEVEICPEVCERGYHLGSDGRYYAAVVASPKDAGCRFSNGAAIIPGETYYFSVDPILWRILAVREGEMLLLSDKIIANMAYQPSCVEREGVFFLADGDSCDIYANNYEHSLVRKWLNGDFLFSAFTSSERERILERVVENGRETLAITDPTPYACRDTYDKLFLLSFRESRSEELGLASPKAGVLEVTDYARATGAFASMGEVGFGCGFWWLRSPNDRSSNLAMSVTSSEKYSRTVALVRVPHVGVAPALRLKTDE